MMSVLTELPPELLSTILEHSDWRSIVQAREVSHLWRDIIDESATLQYKISLAVAGLENGSAPTPTGAYDRLKQLQQYQLAWNKLQWSSQTVIPHQRGGLWELYSGVLGQVAVDQTFTFHRLPSDLRQIPFQEWSVKGPDFVVRDFGMDYSEDLLVWIENPRWQPLHLQNRNYRIHLRSLSNGSPHPSAPKSAVLLKKQRPADPLVSFGLQICGTYLGIHFVSHSRHAVHEICVWNWKTGELLLHLFGDEMTSFVFLSERHIIITCVLWDVSFMGLLKVVNFLEVSSERTNVNDVDSATFRLPHWDSQSQLLNLTIRCDPAPGWKPVEPEAPFVMASDERLLVVSMQAQVMGNHVSTALFALQSILLRLVNMDEGWDNLGIPWSLWGPDNTRILELNSSPSGVWVCYTFGTRFIHQRSQFSGEFPDIEVYADVYDFNQLAIRKEDDEGYNKPSSVIPSKLKMFTEDVVTSLPYRKTSINLTEHRTQLNAVMCSQDNLILVCRDRRYRILNF